MFWCLTLLIFFSNGSLHASTFYTEYWPRLFWSMWEKDSFKVGTFIKIETDNHLRTFRLLLLSEQLSYRVSKDFSLELHFTYVNGRGLPKHSPWSKQYRLELEANPSFHLPYNTLLKTRNRLEIRKFEDNSKINFRLRQMTTYLVPIENAGSLQSFSMSNELFYDFSNNLFDQDRFCPCQFTFGLFENVKLDLFFLLRFFISNGEWQRSAVFGTQVNF